ncbi:MAG TPA: RNA polymerase sigma factor [Xanthobacteraceae bacterium]|nr:RNA polymerase sigma factor [Xanthobacteraceae bacterium]
MAHQAPRLDEADEQELLARARRNEESAVRALIQRYNRRLFRLARSIVREDSEAEDVVQEAYVRAFTRLAEFRAESSFSTWLSRIVLNEALGRLRKRRRTADWLPLDTLAPSAEIIPFPLASNSPDPERTMAQREIRTLLERAIDDLPEAFRTVLVARVLEEMSIEETADLLGLRPETVKTRLHRARRLLRDALERQVGPVLPDAFPFDGVRCQRLADAVIRRLGIG